jgi:pyrroline-5-carboxylate reductase
MVVGPRTKHQRRMQANAIVFLGGGRVTSAMTAGLRLAGCREKISVYDRNPEKLRALRRESQVEIPRDLESALAHAEMLIVAVRPNSVAEILAEVEDCGISPPKLCVSLAAGVPLSKLRARLRSHWVRAMPSPVCRVGRGLTALCFDRNVAKRDRDRVRRFFALVGEVLEISENRFDAFTAVYSSSHGYHALAALAKAGEQAGLDRATALTAGAHALGDGISYWRESQSPLPDLLREAATPGGIAAETISAMNDAGYSEAISKGIKAGIRRARMNARR